MHINMHVVYMIQFPQISAVFSVCIICGSHVYAFLISYRISGHSQRRYISREFLNFLFYAITFITKINNKFTSPFIGNHSSTKTQSMHLKRTESVALIL